jgi:hypothetical protein
MLSWLFFKIMFLFSSPYLWCSSAEVWFIWKVMSNGKESRGDFQDCHLLSSWVADASSSLCLLTIQDAPCMSSKDLMPPAPPWTYQVWLSSFVKVHNYFSKMHSSNKAKHLSHSIMLCSLSHPKISSHVTLCPILDSGWPHKLNERQDIKEQ